MHDAALEALVRAAGDSRVHVVLESLRRRKRNVAAIAACHEAVHPFESRLDSAIWPTIGAAVTDYLVWLAAARTASTRRRATPARSRWRPRPSSGPTRRSTA